MLGFNLPGVVDVAPQASIFGSVDPFTAKQPLAVLILFQLIGWEPAKVVTPNFSGLEPLRCLRPKPAVFVLLVPENFAGLFMVGIFAQRLPRTLNGKRWLFTFCSRFGRRE